MCGLRSRFELLGLLALAAVSCGRPAADAHYHARGVVESSSGSGEDARAAIRHERIEAFKDRDGKASPMHSMSMNFAIAKGVDTRALVPGAKVEFEFDVRWSSGAPLSITRVTALPADTALVLSK
jgi:hypothetical protein